nr:ABC transporter permease [Microlunatus panaciterrae]
MRLELRKLLAQKRIIVVWWVCVLAPILLVGVLKVASTTPSDTLFGRWVHVSGLALPLLVLGFGGQWAFPALAALVAGDVFAAEDRYATWKLVLSRSRSRAEVFAGKCLVGLGFPVVMTLVVAAISTGAGVFLVGSDPIINLSGSLVQVAKGVELVAWSGLSQLCPVLALASFALLLSVVTRNSLVGVGGPVLFALVAQLGALTDLPPTVRMLSPAGAFACWHGLWLDRPDVVPLWLGVSASLLTAVTCLAIAATVFVRRDVAVR